MGEEHPDVAIGMRIGQVAVLDPAVRRRPRCYPRRKERGGRQRCFRQRRDTSCRTRGAATTSVPSQSFVFSWRDDLRALLAQTRGSSPPGSGCQSVLNRTSIAGAPISRRTSSSSSAERDSRPPSTSATPAEPRAATTLPPVPANDREARAQPLHRERLWRRRSRRPRRRTTRASHETAGCAGDRAKRVTSIQWPSDHARVRFLSRTRARRRRSSAGRARRSCRGAVLPVPFVGCVG